MLAFFGIVCVAPLHLGGLKGKKSTPSIGWEVSVRSQRLASDSDTKRIDITRSRRSGNGMFFICMIEGISTLDLSYCYQHFVLAL